MATKQQSLSPDESHDDNSSSTPAAPWLAELPKLDLTVPLQTRLLYILPANKTGTLRCRLAVVSLADDIEFFALSYAWGRHTSGNELYIEYEQQRLAISETLHGFLRFYEQHYAMQPLWIDALCIDQDDDLEKSYQIPNMRHVYSKAKKVVIWLGMEDESTEAVLELLERLDQASHVLEKQGLELNDRSCLRFVKAGSIESFDKPIWKDLNRFYQRSWFHRLWTLQEDLLARDRVYVCGRHAFSANLVTSGSAWLDTYQKHRSEFFTPIDTKVDVSSAHKNYHIRLDYDVLRSHLNPLDDNSTHNEDDDNSENDESRMLETTSASQDPQSSSGGLPQGFMEMYARVSVNPETVQNEGYLEFFRFEGNSVPLHALLRLSQGRKTSVAKDHVFALLGIADEANTDILGDKAIKLDYSQHEILVFIHTTRFLIEHHRSLEVLKMVQYLPTFENEVLTWVPRWDVAALGRARILSEPEDETKFLASGSVPLTMEGLDDPYQLAVHGQRFDRITYVSNIISWSENTHPDQFSSTRVSDIFEDFKTNVIPQFGIASYPTGETFRTVFAMTLIGGLDENGRPADPDAFLKHFLYQYAVEIRDKETGNSGADTLRWLVRWNTGFRQLERDRLVSEIKGGDRSKFLKAFRRAAEHRRYFLTSTLR